MTLRFKFFRPTHDLSFRTTAATTIRRSPSARTTAGRAASGSRSASPPTSRSTRSARGAGTTTPSTASRRPSATTRGATTATASASGGCSILPTNLQHAARAQHQQPALRARAADLRAHPRARRRDRRARPHQCREPSTISAGRPTRRASSARSPRPSPATKASRRKGWMARRLVRELVDARPAEGSGLHLPVGLAVRRPADLDAHALGPDPVGAVSGRAQRFAADHPPPAHRRANSATCWSISSRRWSSRARKHPLVCNISIHPHVFGYPFRLRPLRTGAAALLRQQVHGPRLEVQAGRRSPTTAYALKPGIIPGS